MPRLTRISTSKCDIAYRVNAVGLGGGGEVRFERVVTLPVAERHDDPERDVVFYEEVIHPAATEVVRGNAYSSRERPSRRRPLWRPSFGPCPSFSRSGAHRRRRRTLDARADAARRAGETSDLLSRETDRKTSRDEIEIHLFDD